MGNSDPLQQSMFANPFAGERVQGRTFTPDEVKERLKMFGEFFGVEQPFSESIRKPVDAPEFDGVTYEPKKDFARLSGQLLRVFEVMKDGRWYGASQLCELANVSPLSITARIRDLRKGKFGSHTIERKLISGGYHEYRINAANPKTGG